MQGRFRCFFDDHSPQEPSPLGRDLIGRQPVKQGDRDRQGGIADSRFVENVGGRVDGVSVPLVETVRMLVPIVLLSPPRSSSHVVLQSASILNRIVRAVPKILTETLL